MLRHAAVLALLPALAAAQGEERLDCATESGGQVSVLIGASSRFGATLHCVDAPGLREVVAGCAPDGGWGLSAGDGSQDLLGVATDPRGLGHDGGWFFARLGPSEFVASAAVGRAPPLALAIGGGTFWRLRLTLATGRGIVETRASEEEVVCGAAAP